MTHNVLPDAFPPRDDTLVLGATVRTLGAWPSGWRYPGAHRNPHGDPAVLRSIAATAEDAGLHFLFFGDWLATGPEFEYTDPYLLARIEPFAAIGYLAATTRRIGLIATVSSSYSEAFTTARAAASIDHLTGGRVGISVSAGAEPRSARNFGWENVHSDVHRYVAAGEFIGILRGLWDSWDDDAFIADAASGRLIDPDKLHPLEYVGSILASSGPLNVLRPPQGQLPIAVVGNAVNSRDLAVREADIVFVSPRTFDEAVDSYAETRRQVASAGRNPDDVRFIMPILPIVAATRQDAWDLYDELVALVPVEDGTSASQQGSRVPLPANRGVRTLASVLGVPFVGLALDDAVAPRIAARFSDRGRYLTEVVKQRSGRTIGGERPVTYRHLLVAHAIAVPVLVGSGTDIADYAELWFRARAVDGFTVLSAYIGEPDAAGHRDDQFDAFASLVVPELRRRGLLAATPAGATLRERLGLPAVPSVHTAVGLVPLQ